MALSHRRYSRARLFLTGTQPLRGFWITAGQGDLDRNRPWVYRNGRLSGPAEDDDRQRLTESARAMEDLVNRCRRQGTPSFLKLSGVAKVEGPSWSLPAVASCPVIDETCNDCYALAGFYQSNLAAQVGRVLRHEWLQELIRDGDLGPWTCWMVHRLNALPASRVPGELGQCFFRWHDSGDIFHIDYGRALLNICSRTPGVRHWLPTRMGALVARLAEEAGELPDNLSIRISCVHGGRYEATQIDALALIKHIHPGANAALTYTDVQSHASRPDWNGLERRFGPSVAPCPVTISAAHARRTCGGCRKCWGLPAHGPTVYVIQAAVKKR